jgi:hypothetical protein
MGWLNVKREDMLCRYPVYGRGARSGDGVEIGTRRSGLRGFGPKTFSLHDSGPKSVAPGLPILGPKPCRLHDFEPKPRNPDLLVPSPHRLQTRPPGHTQPPPFRLVLSAPFPDIETSALPSEGGREAGWRRPWAVDSSSQVSPGSLKYRVAIKPRNKNDHSSYNLFRSFPGQTWPRDTLQRVRLEQWCRTHVKLSPETIYKAITVPLPGLGQKS